MVIRTLATYAGWARCSRWSSSPDKAARRFFDPKTAAHRVVAAKALEMGVLTRALPFIEVNAFSPPLCMSRAVAEEAVERYGKALDAVTPDLARLASTT